MAPACTEHFDGHAGNLGGDYDFDESSWIGISHPQLAAKFFDALPHASDAHANAAGLEFCNEIVDTLTVIAHCNCNLIVVLYQCDPAVVRSGMTENIGEGFLNNAEGCGFQLRGEPGKFSWLYIEQSFNAAALGKSIHIPLDRGV